MPVRWTQEDLDKIKKRATQKDLFTGRERKVTPLTRQPEYLECVALIQWRDAQLALKRMPELALLIHIPNGGARTKAAAGAYKAIGVRPGVSDYLLPVARGGFHGLWLEIKRPDGGKGLSEEQTQWLGYMLLEGYRTAVCNGARAAIEVIVGYLNSK